MTEFLQKPEKKISLRISFGIDSDMEVMGFEQGNEFVPEIDPSYKFHRETSLAILAGFVYNRKIMIQGFHGTGKSTHIEQIAARLNWPCIRVNLDGNISRTDLIGKNAIIVKDGKQITEFSDGIIPWSLKRPIAIVFDEYDAARPDVMFILQRLLEADGKFTLLDKNQVITPHKYYRIFATANTVGLGDDTGLYHGVQPINQGQMDRWNMVVTLNYLSADEEIAIILSKIPTLSDNKKLIETMVAMANLTRSGFKNSDISTVMSPRTVITWAENYLIFKDVDYAFKVTFLNKCDENEKPIIAEYYQRCFDVELLAPITDLVV